MSRRRLIIALFCAALASPVYASDFTDHIRATNPPQPLQPLVFEDANGQQHALSDYRGRYVLLNVWATWCGPCVTEMPSLDKAAASFDPHKLIVLPLSEDRGDATVTSFYRTHALRHLPVAIDTAGIAPATLHLHGVPTTLVIDPQGREIARLEGDANWASPEAADFLRAQIADK